MITFTNVNNEGYMEASEHQGRTEQYTSRGQAVGKELAFVALAEVYVRTDAPNDGWWGHQALCAQIDPAIFFPERGGSAVESKKICQQCPVKNPCLESALADGDDEGTRGGYSSSERRAMRAQRKRQTLRQLPE